jgi:peptidoglycan-associated lipoprotein
MINYSFRIPSNKKVGLTFVMGLMVIASSCGKKTPIPPPPPPPAPVANNTAPSGPTTAGRPTVAEFSVEPTTIERGQSAVLRWSVTGSTNVAINNGIGTVTATGNRRVQPGDTTTYTLTATGRQGDTTATANNRGAGTLESRAQGDLRDGLFDYDSNNIRDDARAALTTDADALKRIMLDFPTATINVEGHCDERGSAEYNLGLGDRRASSARDFLIQLGVPGDRLKTISYGKERPVCTEADESCWQRNRRAHFSVGQ